MVNANIQINNYTNRVLSVIKAKYGLNDKGEAVDWFIEKEGDKYVEKEVNEEILKELINNYEKYKKKYPKRRMTIKELDSLCGVSD